MILLKNTLYWVFLGCFRTLFLSNNITFVFAMIIQTSTSDFLIEECGKTDGCVFVYSDSLEEIQRLFGSSEVEYSMREDWKFRVCTCKQDLANALILMVKEINYRDFVQERFQQA